eukprot:3936225-Rhodomonas_salina.1
MPCGSGSCERVTCVVHGGQYAAVSVEFGAACVHRVVVLDSCKAHRPVFTLERSAVGLLSSSSLVWYVRAPLNPTVSLSDTANDHCTPKAADRPCSLRRSVGAAATHSGSVGATATHSAAEAGVWCKDSVGLLWGGGAGMDPPYTSLADDLITSFARMFSPAQQHPRQGKRFLPSVAHDLSQFRIRTVASRRTCA